MKINISKIIAGIPILTFYGYFFAYAYEETYLSNYGIPIFLIQISINNIIQTSVYFTIFFMLIILVMFPSVPLLNKFKKNFFLYPLILLLTIIGSYALISAYFFPVGLSQLPAIIVLTASFIIFADFILPILKYRTFNNLKNNIINDRTNTRANNNSNILLQSKNQYFNIIIFAIFLLFLTYAVASVIANMNVQSNSIYYTFKKDKGTYALIRTYGDENISEKVKSNILDPGSIYIFKSDSLILEKESLKLPTIKSQNPL